MADEPISEKKRPATLGDVARLAGVSASTVSRALSRPDLVNEATRERITWAVSRLGYIPHGAARALAGRGHRAVGVVIPSLRFGVFAELVETIQARLDEAGFGILLGHTGGDPEREYEQARALVERGVDALVLIGNAQQPRLLRLITDVGVPVVTAFDYDENSALPCVGVDNEAAGRCLAEHLLDQGYDEIAIITQPTLSNDRSGKRVDGVASALRQIGRAVRPEFLIECDGLAPSARDAMGALLGGEKRPRAVVCFSDLMAIAATAECRAQGIAVPGEIAIAGISGIGLSDMVDPPLTSVRIPAVEIGDLIAERLLAHLMDRAAVGSALVAHELLLRESTGALREL